MQFQYISLYELRAEGLLSSEMDDNRALTMIRRMSSKINLFTGQFFQPEIAIVKVDGDGSAYCSYHNAIKIIKVNSLKVASEHSRYRRENYANTGLDIISDNRAFGNITRFAINDREREIEIFGGRSNRFYNGEKFPAVFPEGSSNIEIDGVFGWLENKKDFTTHTVIAYTALDTEIELDDISGLDLYDDIIIELSNKNVIRRIVNINYDTSIITIDATGRPIPINTNIVSYGGVPSGVAEAIMHLINRFRARIFEDDGTSGLMGAITEEHTDNYKYKVEAKLSGGLWNKDLTTFASTGSHLVDAILDEYCSPAFIGAV